MFVALMAIAVLFVWLSYAMNIQLFHGHCVITNYRVAIVVAEKQYHLNFYFILLLFIFIVFILFGLLFSFSFPPSSPSLPTQQMCSDF
jgi:hypothetical protein